MDHQSSPQPGLPRFQFPLELRWSDQDRLGHVNNAKIVTLAEESRVRFIEHTAPDQPSTAEVARVVARQTIDYHAEVHYGPELTMWVGAVRVGNTSYTLRQQGHQNGRAVFTVDTVLVQLGPDRRPLPLGDAERAVLTEWAWPTDPAESSAPQD